MQPLGWMAGRRPARVPALLNALRCLRAMAVATAVVGSPGAVAAETGYGGSTWEPTGGFLSVVDLESGAGQMISPTGRLGGLAFSPAGELFGTLVTLTPADPPGLPLLVRVDLALQTFEVRGALAVSSSDLYFDLGLTFDAVGRLWLATSEGKLYQVDPADGAVSLHADLGIPLQGLAGCGSTLFSLTHPTFPAVQPVRLVRIDPDHGTAVVFGPGVTSIFGDAGGGLDFSADGRLYAVLRNEIPIGHYPSFVAELDPVTGALLHGISGGGVNALAIAPPPTSCPSRGAVDVPAVAPGGLKLLSLTIGLAALTVLRARRRVRQG